MDPFTLGAVIGALIVSPHVASEVSKGSSSDEDARSSGCPRCGSSTDHTYYDDDGTERSNCPSKYR